MLQSQIQLAHLFGREPQRNPRVAQLECCGTLSLKVDMLRQLQAESTMNVHTVAVEQFVSIVRTFAVTTNVSASQTHVIISSSIIRISSLLSEEARGILLTAEH